MSNRLINIGLGSFVREDRIVSMVSPESAPLKRLITDARAQKKLVDATYGRRTRAVIVMDSGHVVLSNTQPETIANRITESPSPSKFEQNGHRLTSSIIGIDPDD